MRREVEPEGAATLWPRGAGGAGWFSPLSELEASLLAQRPIESRIEQRRRSFLLVVGVKTVESARSNHCEEETSSDYSSAVTVQRAVGIECWLLLEQQGVCLGSSSRASSLRIALRLLTVALLVSVNILLKGVLIQVTKSSSLEQRRPYITIWTSQRSR